MNNVKLWWSGGEAERTERSTMPGLSAPNGPRPTIGELLDERDRLPYPSQTESELAKALRVVEKQDELIHALLRENNELRRRLGWPARAYSGADRGTTTAPPTSTAIAGAASGASAAPRARVPPPSPPLPRLLLLYKLNASVKDSVCVALQSAAAVPLSKAHSHVTWHNVDTSPPAMVANSDASPLHIAGVVVTKIASSRFDDRTFATECTAVSAAADRLRQTLASGADAGGTTASTAVPLIAVCLHFVAASAARTSTAPPRVDQFVATALQRHTPGGVVHLAFDNTSVDAAAPVNVAGLLQLAHFVERVPASDASS